MDVTLYTIDCPKCKVLEKKLDIAGIQYTADRDVEKMKSLGIKSAPVLAIDGKLLKYTDAVLWLKENS